MDPNWDIQVLWTMKILLLFPDVTKLYHCIVQAIYNLDVKHVLQFYSPLVVHCRYLIPDSYLLDEPKWVWKIQICQRLIKYDIWITYTHKEFFLMQWAAVKIHLSLISEPPHLQSNISPGVSPYPNTA